MIMTIKLKCIITYISITHTHTTATSKMVSTKLITTNNTIGSLEFIPENVRPLVHRRTANHKQFGKLEIQIPSIEPNTTTTTSSIKSPPQRVVAGFLLDTSGSMKGEKIEYAINTVRKFMEVIHAERNGNTIETQPFHAWMYLITFNSDANLVIPFQEITDETIPKINELLDKIKADKCTNYEEAFRKQTEVLEEILQQITEPTTILRIFETDGDITEGTRQIEKLYKMMRSTATAAAAAAATTTTGVVFEDYVLGYGKDVDLVCLKALASPYAPAAPAPAAAPAAAPAPAPAEEESSGVSTLVTILEPEEIGWKVGEILSKFIMRYGINFQVSVVVSPNQEGEGKIELFEYETDQWSTTTKVQAMMYGETKTLWVQYTPEEKEEEEEEGSIITAAVAVHVKIQYEIQRTRERFTYTFEHNMNIAPEEESATATATVAAEDVLSLINGMIHIEILKQYREIEADRYEMDTIVREAYKTKRMLNSIHKVVTVDLGLPSNSVIACQTANLMTDVKVAIGLTTIQNTKEQQLILHARRICSAEQELYNTGASVSRKYFETEEEHEETAIQVIEAYRRRQKQQDNADADAADAADAPPDASAAAAAEDDEYCFESDSLPSIVPFFPSTTTTAKSGHRHNHHHRQLNGSELRRLCVKIAMAKSNNEDITAEQIYEKMMTNDHIYYYDDDYMPHYCGGGGGCDDTFSSTPMDDVYTRRRMGIMRHMSSQ